MTLGMILQKEDKYRIESSGCGEASIDVPSKRANRRQHRINSQEVCVLGMDEGEEENLQTPRETKLITGGRARPGGCSAETHAVAVLLGEGAKACRTP